ncbi:MAG: histidine phosphatase family protein [Pseudomonadales bacterium]|nr:histidine phosphatase family protein [Pseudomonadales bacterium]
MKVLYLIRHGQSENNAFAAEAGPDEAEEPPRTADPSLTKAGYEQAKCVAEHLAREADKTDCRDGTPVEGGYGIQRLYTSAMLRALETTQPIATTLGLRPEIWLDVHEEGGIWLDAGDGRGAVGHPGLTRSAIAQQFPGFLQPEAITDDGWWNRPFERRADLVSRSAEVAADVRRRVPEWENRVAIVSHGTFISLLVQHLLLGQYVPDIRFSNHNTGISRLDFDGDSVMLRYLNRIDHLPVSLVT